MAIQCKQCSYFKPERMYSKANRTRCKECTRRNVAQRDRANKHEGDGSIRSSPEELKDMEDKWQRDTRAKYPKAEAEGKYEEVQE